MTKTEAFILRKQPLGEADELIMCFTKEEGKMLFRARGVRKAKAKHAGPLRQCNRTDVYYVEGRRGPLVTDTTLQESFSGIRESEHKLTAAQKVCETLARVVPSSFPDLVLWWQLSEYLQVLENYEEELGHVALAPTFFMFTFLRLHGTRMGVSKCAFCAQEFADEDVFYLSPEHGGLVHATCVSDEDALFELSPVGRAVLQTWSSLSFSQVLAQEFSEEVVEEVATAVEKFAAWHLGERAVIHK